MFESLGAFWRRVLRRRAEPATGAGKTGDERRVWIRYPANVETTYRRATDSEETTRLSALLRNISQGGISLQVRHEFKVGDLLSVDLPGPDDKTTLTVLACVIHVVPHGGGEWTLGCNFSRELSDEDLQAFGARRVKHDSDDQRTWMRFACDVQAVCQVVTAPEQGRWPAQVLNISASGVGLLVDRAIETGTLLSVDLHSATGPGARTILACVVHVSTQPEGEWALGCNFIRALSEEDLRALS
jgi:c-di-GMP-binding flagellar brake protein YcgR